MKRFLGLFAYLKGKAHLPILALVFALFAVGAKLAVPYLTGLCIDAIRNGNDDIGMYLWIIIAILIAGAVGRYFFTYFVSITGETIVKEMRQALYRKLIAAPVSYFDSRKEGDLLLLFTNDIDTVRTGLVSGSASFFEGAVQILATIGLMLYLNWVLALVVIVLTPLSIVVSRIISKANAKSFRAQAANMAALSGQGNETISNLETVQSYGIEGLRTDEFKAKAEEVRKSQFKAVFASAWINPSSRLVNNLIYGAVVMMGCYLLFEQPEWLGRVFTVGYLSSFLTYAYQYMAPFNEVADASGDILYALSSFGRFEETMSGPMDCDDGQTLTGPTIGEFTAEDVHFGYTSEREVLSGISFSIKKGQTVALVGTTGCGKTTLINLLMRFYDPQSGEIRVDETPLSKVPKSDLRRHFGMVLQQTVLFHGTIADNIAFGKEEATREEIEQAAKLAKADALISKLPQGYDTPIHSCNLSGGERQLICLARVLLSAPEVVLLDEATSNIDLRTEIALSGGFDTLLKGKTAVVVAHRLSTIVGSDMILVMDRGQIIERGTFGELMAQNGFFAKLYKAQFE